VNLIIPGLILWAAGSAIGIGLARLFNWTASSLPVVGGLFPMAVDTRDERSSQINLLMPWRMVFPLPDGTIGAADRQHQAWLYAGILAGGAVPAGYRTPMTVLSSLPWGPI
jgi:hypothetical protein